MVGDEEMKGEQVNIRWRDNTSAQDRGQPITLAEAVEKLKQLKTDLGSYNPFPQIEKAAKEEAPAA